MVNGVQGRIFMLEESGRGKLLTLVKPGRSQKEQPETKIHTSQSRPQELTFSNQALPVNSETWGAL